MRCNTTWKAQLRVKRDPAPSSSRIRVRAAGGLARAHGGGGGGAAGLAELFGSPPASHRSSV